MSRSLYRGKEIKNLRKSVKLKDSGAALLIFSIFLVFSGSFLGRMELLSAGLFSVFIFSTDLVVLVFAFSRSSAHVRRIKAPKRIVLGSGGVFISQCVIEGLSILRAVMRDPVPETVTVEGRNWSEGKERIRVSYVVKPIYRGKHEIGPLVLVVNSALGLFVGEYVFPNATTHEIEAVPTFYAEPFRSRPIKIRYASPGSHPVLIKGGYGDFLKLRSYVPGDDIRLIHWPATAKNVKGVPLVKELSIESQLQLFVVVDPSIPTYFEYVIGRRIIDDFVDAAGGIVFLAMRYGDPVGFYLAGSPVLTLPPTRRVDYIYSALKVLEDMLPTYPTRLEVLPDLAGRILKRGTLVIILTPLWGRSPNEVLEIAASLKALQLRPIFILPDLREYVEMKLPPEILLVLRDELREESERVKKLMDLIRSGGGEAILASGNLYKESAVSAYLTGKGMSVELVKA